MSNYFFKKKYPAFLEFADDGISISFPDFPECYSCAFNYDEAFKMAYEALELTLHGMDVSNVPEPTVVKNNLNASKKTIYINIKMEIKNAKLYSPNVVEFKE